MRLGAANDLALTSRAATVLCASSFHLQSTVYLGSYTADYTGKFWSLYRENDWAILVLELPEKNAPFGP